MNLLPLQLHFVTKWWRCVLAVAPVWSNVVSSQFLPSRTGYKSYARTCVAEERSILFSLEKLSVPQIAPGLVSLVMIKWAVTTWLWQKFMNFTHGLSNKLYFKTQLNGYNLVQLFTYKKYSLYQALLWEHIWICPEQCLSSPQLNAYCRLHEVLIVGVIASYSVNE